MMFTLLIQKSTASLSEEFNDEKDLPQLERTKSLEESNESLHTGPPGTVKKRIPKKEKQEMDDAEVVRILTDLCINEDPLLIYYDMVKIGQG